MTTITVDDLPRRRIALPKRALLVAGAAAAVIALGAGWIAMPASSVSTDDAYVKADSTIVAPKVQGLIAQVLVRDNQRVVRGQALIRIDDSDYAQAVRAAEAEVQAAEASLAQLPAQEALAASNAQAAQAAIRAADAERVRAATDRVRFETLARTGDISRAQADRATATALTASADADKSRAAFQASRSQQDVIAAGRGQLEAALAKARASLSLARQNLAHTVVRAPVDGVVGDRQAQLGEYVQPGTQLMTVVPLDTIYVTANFKETQTARMLAGQKARVSIDALPGREFSGEVESFAPGSGSEFSLLPYEPATGNFTRIVQRVPVRIRIALDPDAAQRIRPGLSAEVTVRLKD
ncbi:MAG TPA: HlyD family secretion protein [Rhizomicrobium sp.]|nr:HlyD family secretion protein [Rhizomicrobium sp.]